MRDGLWEGEERNPIASVIQSCRTRCSSDFPPHVEHKKLSYQWNVEGAFSSRFTGMPFDFEGIEER